jgi:hypothetical protein
MSVELGDLTLSHLTHIAVREQARIVRHPVPGMSGDLSQILGRPSVEVLFQGIFYGPEALEELGQLRAAQLENSPVDFFTEAVGEGYFSQVLITRLEVSQRAGYLDQFDYICQVVEYIEPPEPVLAAPSLFGDLDAGLLGEAMAFVDDVQNALEQVSDLVDLVANAPKFGDPTTRLPGMLDQFSALTGGGVGSLNNLLELFS